MSATDSPAPATRRDLKSPYFLYRTPDGTGSYFTAENLPIIMSPKEPLARFLAPARVIESGTLRSIAYDFDAVPLDTVRPMEFLPQSEIDAFVAAVNAFYDKAHAATARIVPHEKRLRAHFRLPDPDLERDTYWVYGPVHDRRLLILWGCEFKAGTSLALAPDVELKISPGRTVVDRLQARVMTWEQRQREALKLALDPAEPISRFLARPAVDASGQPAGVAVLGQTVPQKNLKPLKHILTTECAAFEKAARRFYDKADDAATSPYEKELRLAFRLPDPDKTAAAFQLHGKSLLVVLEGKESHDSTLPMTDHPALAAAAPAAAPKPAAATDGPVVVASAAGTAASATTVVAKLRRRAVKTGLVAGLAAAAIILLIGGGFAAWQFIPDRTPPKLVDFDKEHSVATPNDTHVIVRFSEPIDFTSIKIDSKEPSFRFDGDKAKVLSATKPDAKDPNTVILTTSRLVDAEAYKLGVRGVTDLAHNPLPATPPLDFKFADTIAPELKLFTTGDHKGKPMISAGDNANQLKLVFTKRLNPDSVQRGNSYSIATVDGTAMPIESAKLDPDDKDEQTVILTARKDFSEVTEYRLESISGVKDTAKQANFVSVPTKGVAFNFTDVLPPRIKDRAASAGKLQLILTFTKSVDKATAEDVANYTATAPDGKSTLVFVPGAARLNEQGNILMLRLAPAKLGEGRYTLTAKNIKDKNNNTSPEPLTDKFEFSDAGDRSPLVLTTVGKIVGNQLKLDFSRVIDPADANDRAKFQLTDDQQHAIPGLSVSQAQRVPDNPTQVMLTLSKNPPGGSRILVSAVGVTDIFGNKQDQPVKLAKPVTVGGVPSSTTEQILAWIGRPALKGNTVTLTVKEEVAKASAQNLDNYEFTPDTIHVTRVAEYRVETDAKSGTRRTIIKLVLEAPLMSPNGVKLAAHDLEAEGLAFLGAQSLAPAELVLAP
jgi:hypothetical protein